MASIAALMFILKAQSLAVQCLKMKYLLRVIINTKQMYSES